MIDIISGILEIPEEERFIGFVGDNLHCQRQFLVHNIDDENCVYRMYLTFNDGTVNYFVLDSEVLSGSTLLTWNILNEHIFTSGTVKAQIKAMSDSGEIYHTNTDFFIVGATAEYTDGFRDNVNSEFLQYEQKLNEILKQINSGELEVVPQNREIAGHSLQNDITAEMLYDSLKVYPVLRLYSTPTTQTQGSICQFALVRSTTNGIDFKNELYICYGIRNNEYMWANLTGSLSGTQGNFIDLGEYATKAYVENLVNNLDLDVADEIEMNENGDLANGDKIASVKCVHDSIDFMAQSIGEEMKLKADKSYVDELFSSIVNGNEVAY